MFNKLAVSGLIVVSMTACSLIDDKADVYQLSQSNTTELVVPQGSVTAKDSLVIPNEDKISDLSESVILASPSDAIPDSIAPIANLMVNSQDDIMWIETPLENDVLRVVIKNFLVSIYGEGDPIEVNSELEVISVPMGDQDIGSLLKLYYNITRLYPDRTEYRFELDDGLNGTKVGFQHRIVSQDQNKNVESSEWLSPDATDEGYTLALQFISAISRESLAQKTGVNLSADKLKIWVTSEGQYALKLNDFANESDLTKLIEQSELNIISRDPLELAFVTEGEVAKIGDLRRINLPTKTKDGEDLFMFNMKRRNLDEVDWQQRAYPVDLVQRAEGLFLEADTSATEHPNVVSYRIMSALQN